MTEIFSEGADLPLLLESGEKLKVSDVVHKAFIEVTEQGTEAGGSTGKMFLLFKCVLLRRSCHVFLYVTAGMLVAYSMPPQFFAKHPFLFYIKESETNTIIFSGRLEKL